MQIRIAGLVPESFVDGDGIRFAIFMQGCLRNCEGCHNPETHALDGGRLIDTAEIVAVEKFSAAELARSAKNLGLSVWCYTGNRFEELTADAQKLLDNVDVLIDGEFVESLRDLELEFRGSSNQRIIDVKKSRAQNKIVPWFGIGG